jgi:uncharacterized membrane protein YkoI
MNGKVLAGMTAVILMSGLFALSAWSDEKPGNPRGHGEGHGGRGSYGMAGHHEGAGHYLRHLLMHQKEIGLTEEQVAKLKAIQLDLDKTRIKAEADIAITEREVRALLEDDKSDLSAIESKIKQSESLEASLRITAIKAKRDAKGLLSPEQRQKEQAEHEKMMRQRRDDHMGGGMRHGMMGMSGHGAASAKEAEKEDEQEAEGEEEEAKEKLELAGQVKVPFDQAAQTAVQKVAGKVIEVELEKADGKVVWEVEILTADGKLEELYVDAVAGGVVEVKEDEEKEGKSR